MITTNEKEQIKTVMLEWLETAGKNKDAIGFNLSVAQNSHVSIELLIREKNAEIVTE